MSYNTNRRQWYAIRSRLQKAGKWTGGQQQQQQPRPATGSKRGSSSSGGPKPKHQRYSDVEPSSSEEESHQPSTSTGVSNRPRQTREDPETITLSSGDSGGSTQENRVSGTKQYMAASNRREDPALNIANRFSQGISGTNLQGTMALNKKSGADESRKAALLGDQNTEARSAVIYPGCNLGDSGQHTDTDNHGCVWCRHRQSCIPTFRKSDTGASVRDSNKGYNYTVARGQVVCRKYQSYLGLLIRGPQSGSRNCEFGRKHYFEPVELIEWNNPYMNIIELADENLYNSIWSEYNMYISYAMILCIAKYPNDYGVSGFYNSDAATMVLREYWSAIGQENWFFGVWEENDAGVLHMHFIIRFDGRIDTLKKITKQSTRISKFNHLYS